MNGASPAHGPNGKSGVRLVSDEERALREGWEKAGVSWADAQEYMAEVKELYAQGDVASLETDKSKPLLRLVDIARTMANADKVQRLATGFETLDASCRGGLPWPRLVVLGGAPGACKTSVAAAMAHNYAKMGIPVAVMAADEGPEGLVMRIAQREMFSVGKLEDGEGDERALEWHHALAVLDALPIFVGDSDDEATTVEGVAAKLFEISQGKPAVLLVDSIQTVACDAGDAGGEPRHRVDSVVRALKRVTSKYKLLVIATCELARGSYRSKDAAAQINDLAAFKESGSIEYAAQTALILRSVAGEGDLFDVAVPKNRGLKKTPFRLELDRARMAFREVPIEDEAEVDDLRYQPGSKRVSVDVETDAAIVKRVLLMKPGMHGFRALRAAIGASNVRMSNTRLDAAVEFWGDAISKTQEGKSISWRFIGKPVIT